MNQSEKIAFFEEITQLQEELQKAERELKAQTIKINILKAKIYGLKYYPIESE